jgi:hypothetical protein
VILAGKLAVLWAGIGLSIGLSAISSLDALGRNTARRVAVPPRPGFVVQDVITPPSAGTEYSGAPGPLVHQTLVPVV